MKNISQEERELYLNSATTKHIRLEFEDGTVLTDEAIYFESMKIEQVLCDDQISFGTCNASEFDIKIYNIPASHMGQELHVTISVNDERNTYERSLGTYIVVSDELTDDKMFREIKAYDLMYRIHNADMSVWYNDLVFPMTLKTFRDSFFNHLEIEQTDVDLANDNMILEKTLQANLISGKDIIQSICEINACFGHVSEDGKFQYVIIKHGKNALLPSNTLYPSDALYPKDSVQHRFTRASFLQGSLKYKDFLSKRITQLQIRMEENDIGITYGLNGNRYIIQDNFLLYGKVEQELEPIADRFLRSIQFGDYTPTEVSCRSMLWAELGDFVTIITARDKINFPILKRTISGIQALKDTYSAGGEETFSENVTSVKSDIIRLKGKSNVLERTIEETKSTITDLESELHNGYSTTSETQSMIDQTASEINLSVSNIQRQVNGQVNTYYGTEIPTLTNYPANEWVTDADKMLHNGDKYFVRNADNQITSAYRFLADARGVYNWTQIADTDVTQAMNTATRALLLAEDNKSQISIQDKEIKQTVATSSTKWVSNFLITFTSYGEPLLYSRFSENPVDKYYLDQITGNVYKCTSYDPATNNATWELIEKATLTTDQINSAITQNANRITLQVNELGQLVDDNDVKYNSLFEQQSNSISAKVSEKGGNNASFGWELLSNGFNLYSRSTKVFQCDSSGVEVNGKITAKTGYIGNGSKGFEINDSSISNGTTSMVSTSSGIYIGVDGINLGGKFKVETTGKITAESGKIAGFDIFNDRMSTSGQLYSSNSGSGIYLGSSGINLGGKFKVSNEGHATISSGAIGGFNIGSSYIASKYTSLLGSGTGVYIGTDGISVGGSTGFVIKSDGNATLKKVTISELDYSGDLDIDDIKVNGKITVVQGINLTTVPRFYNNSIEYMNFSSLDINMLKHIVGSNGAKITGDIDIYSSYTQIAKITSGTTYFEPSTLKLGKSTTTLGFFGGNGSTKKTVSSLGTSADLSAVRTKVNDILTALKAYNLIG